ncbi:60S ribosomal protein L7-4-like isoform X3 [Durio zibethinus]|uniref:60S ribosomal protein L7-4-like isoform X3 n=1 Tax=Durio zibethinus TaxID=66656 RepID=A0A6P5XNW4_DURZI|nr:60S ribosomal protein L7-4-like isoform X3 [Durio zibethinus]
MGEEVKAVIPESLLKRRKRNEEWELAKKQELEAAKKKKVENRKLIYTRAKQYAKEYEAQNGSLKLQKRRELRIAS